MDEMLTAIDMLKCMRKYYNNFQDKFSRKFLIETFSLLRAELGFSVESMKSNVDRRAYLSEDMHNRVIMTIASPSMKVLYDSDSEGELADPEKFEQFILKELRRILRKARRIKK
jgi:hypothetical protein